jgi:hypothetical protein
MLLGIVGIIQLRGNDASAEALARSSAEARCRRALDRVAEALTGIGRTLIFPDPNTALGSSTVTFQHPTGVTNAGVVTWDLQSRLQLVLDPRELDNGIDDDGDGLVDERRLIFTRNIGGAGTQTVVLCNNVPELMPGEVVNGLDDNGNGVSDEAGFNVRRIGDILNVRLCVQQAFGEGQVATSILSTSIVLHY